MFDFMKCNFAADFDPLYDMGLNSFFSSAVFAVRRGTWTIITIFKKVTCRNLNNTWHTTIGSKFAYHFESINLANQEWHPKSYFSTL